MLIRTVRMTFKPDKVEEFLEVFKSNMHKIKGFEGCNYLELRQDYQNESIYTTYSLWDDGQALENYRHSPLFKSVWAKTKPLFDDKPIAFSHKKHIVVE